ncbi:sensor histidine kinase [Promicromonospora sp. AC04]|uniref:sensor histidine kinase n=1 Tax=Promicromonospora sp. AC04 TaxID=2135723 RepID=UPI0018EE6F33|nr:histidine kinase [Promicromonospora sp. AC04]
MEPTARPVLRSRVWLAAAAILGALGLALAATGVEQPVAVLTTVLVAAGVAFLVLLWALARTGQQRRAYEEDLTTWAAERAAQAERLRIARDLHDLASHGLGLITVRAAAARTLDGPGGDAERTQALADIERTGRAATTELRRMLGVLRSPGSETAPLRPAETLDDLPGIVDSARAGGVTAVLAAEDLGEVSAGAQLTVCAIVREALANIARHAGPAAARVVVRRAGDAVVVIVEDDGPVHGWRPHPGAGQGLTGLLERVATLGGSLEADAAGSGFRVSARLPDHPSDVRPDVSPGKPPGNQPGNQPGKVHQ